MKNGRQIKIRYFVAFLSFLVSAIKIAVLASPSPVLSPAGARLLGQHCDTVSASVVDRRLVQPSPQGAACPPGSAHPSATCRHSVPSPLSAFGLFGCMRLRHPSGASPPVATVFPSIVLSFPVLLRL